MRRFFPISLILSTFIFAGVGCSNPARIATQSVARKTSVVEQEPAEIPDTNAVAIAGSGDPASPAGGPTHNKLTPAPVVNDGKLPQFVLLAFDGSESIQMWKDTQAFAAEETAKNTPIHFTYFINAAYLLTPQTKNIYHPPQHPVGTSPIKFGYSQKDVADRIEQMNLAMKAGHELGSHSVGHWNGKTWSADEWKSELTQFDTIARTADKIDGLSIVFPHDPIERRVLQLPPGGFAGFRAPELGVSPGLWPTLKALGYRYDTSTVGQPESWPKKDAAGLWSFPLALVPYNGTNKKIIAMDYNFYFKQSGGVEDPAAVKGSLTWQAMHDATLKTYTDYFDKNYSGSRAPVQIGHHFSTWNDSAYWDAMKDFAATECGKPDVKCVTFSELADWLDAHTKDIPTVKVK